MKILYIEWNDPVSKLWFTVGKLTECEDKFVFQYTKGAANAERFTPFGMMSDLKVSYESEELFPLFANRLLNKSRPEYDLYLSWLNLSNNSSPIEILSISQGLRGTDSLRVFSLPDYIDGKYKVTFFVCGISHMVESVAGRIDKLSVGDDLYLMDDVQNKFNNALALRTEEPKTMVGYLPSFLSCHLKNLLHNNYVSVRASVIQVNDSAPLPYRLLCQLMVDGYSESDLFESDEYEVLG